MDMVRQNLAILHVRKTDEQYPNEPSKLISNAITSDIHKIPYKDYICVI